MKPALLFLLLSNALLSSAQNIGIGTENPTRAKFEVHGVAGAGATTAIFGGEGHGISLQRNWPTIGFNNYNNGIGRYLSTGYAAAQYLDPFNGGLYFDLYNYGSTNTGVFGTTRSLSLFSNGNVGIRGAGNFATLTVARGTAFDGTALFHGTQYNSHFNYSSAENTYIRGGKVNSRVYINDFPTGKVLVGVQDGNTRFGINAFDPMYTLEVVQAGNTGMILINPSWGWKAWELRSDKYNSDPNATQTCLSLYYNGRSNPIMGWFRPDNGAYSANSDLRMKSDIQSLEPVLERVMKLKPTRYKMKDVVNAKASIGLLAQEAFQLFPEMISIHENSGDNKGVPMQMGIDYGSFSIVALKAIQEQQNTIQKQEKEIADLKKRLERIEQLLTARQ
jgi:hypothetical protein